MFSKVFVFTVIPEKKEGEFEVLRTVIGRDEKTLKGAGFTTPMPIQEKTLQLILSGWDIIGLAQTGTGKTAAFAVPIIEEARREEPGIQALVICPTRELALQTTGVFRQLSAHTKLRTVSVYGGQSVNVQLKALRAGAQIVVGTPGRVLDLIRRGALKLSHVNTVVLDEADEMLNFGFLPDIRAIFSHITGEHQTLLFSATMNKAVLGITKQFQDDPVRIEVSPSNEPIRTVKHSFLTAGERQKPRAVKPPDR